MQMAKTIIFIFIATLSKTRFSEPNEVFLKWIPLQGLATSENIGVKRMQQLTQQCYIECCMKSSLCLTSA